MQVLIVYYSTYGNVFRMAQLVAEGVREVPGAEPLVRTVPELIPATVVASRPDMKAGRELQKDVPLGHGRRFPRGRGDRLRHAHPLRQRLVATQEPDRPTHRAVA